MQIKELRKDTLNRATFDTLKIGFSPPFKAFTELIQLIAFGARVISKRIGAELQANKGKYWFERVPSIDIKFNQ